MKCHSVTKKKCDYGVGNKHDTYIRASNSVRLCHIYTVIGTCNKFVSRDKNGNYGVGTCGMILIRGVYPDQILIQLDVK